MFKHLLVVLFLVPVSLLAAKDINYQKINQGDWAVVLVRGLNLDQGRELAKIDDFIALLKEKNIEPKDGWKPAKSIEKSDYIGTLGKSLVYLNSRDSKKNKADYDNFLALLEKTVGIDPAQLLSILPGNESLRNLSQGIASYLAEHPSEATGGAGSTGSAQAPTDSKRKTGTSGTNGASSTQLAGVSITISDLATALGLTPASPDYNKVFSKPASPILPF